MNIKKRNVISVILALTFILSLITTVSAEENINVPILLYHNILEDITGADPMLNVTPETFEMHMDAIIDAEYNVITYEDYENYCKNGTRLPEKPIIISFDDGYESNYTYAYPILKRLGLKATIFVITSRMGAGTDTVKYPHFGWDEAREMQESGVIDIQSHSHTHPNFNLISMSQAIREMRLSKYLVETNMQKECRYMAYPYGGYSDFSTYVAQQAGYTLVNIVGDSGSNNKGTDLYHLKRLTVSANHSAEELLEYIDKNVNK